MSLIQQMPLLRFECFLTYLTEKGHTKEARITTQAIAADLAMDKADKRLRADKRRNVACVIYGKAIQL